MMEKRFYEVKFTESAEKDLKKLSKTNKAIAKLLKKWILENLINTQNPKQRGKALTGNLKGLWRYRVGSYRIVAEIKDEVLLILIVEISDRRETYKNKKRKKYKDDKIK
ncbi:addiction module toxin, RelE/StbE family [Leptotrichia hofstadii F0254]|uniref:Addiction module toxin, RelE/StbE family n=2 Tax=Leptotrichia hofstadii TaxID=157688 RepID=C9MZK9_9FUSO|nr:addiction module toxin, RelE/StbE family [Leptotrichia hofstadii F0254]